MALTHYFIRKDSWSKEIEKDKSFILADGSRLENIPEFTLFTLTLLR